MIYSIGNSINEIISDKIQNHCYLRVWYDTELNISMLRCFWTPYQSKQREKKSHTAILDILIFLQSTAGRKSKW